MPLSDWLFSFESACFPRSKHKKTNIIVEDSLKAAIRYRDSLLHKAKKSYTIITSQLDKIEYYTTSFDQINSALSKGIIRLKSAAGCPG